MKAEKTNGSTPPIGKARLRTAIGTAPPSASATPRTRSPASRDREPRRAATNSPATGLARLARRGERAAAHERPPSAASRAASPNGTASRNGTPPGEQPDRRRRRRTRATAIERRGRRTGAGRAAANSAAAATTASAPTSRGPRQRAERRVEDAVGEEVVPEYQALFQITKPWSENRSARKVAAARSWLDGAQTQVDERRAPPPAASGRGRSSGSGRRPSGRSLYSMALGAIDLGGQIDRVFEAIENFAENLARIDLPLPGRAPCCSRSGCSSAAATPGRTRCAPPTRTTRSASAASSARSSSAPG